MTHQASWLDGTGVCGMQQIQAGGSSVRKIAKGPVVGSLGQVTRSADL